MSPYGATFRNNMYECISDFSTDGLRVWLRLGQTSGGDEAHVDADSTDALEELVGDGGQFLGGYPEGGAGDADRGHRQALGVEDRDGDAAEAFFKLFVIDSVAAAAGLFNFSAEGFGGADGAMGEALELGAAMMSAMRSSGKEGEDGLADGSAMDWVTCADAGDHADGARGLDFVDVNDVGALENAEVRGLLGFCDEAAEMGLGAVAEVVLLNGAVAEVEEAQAETELAGGGALDHAMALENHEESMGGALVKLQSRSDLRQAEGGIALAEKVEYGKGPVEGLDFVGTCGGCVAHSAP